LNEGLNSLDCAVAVDLHVGNTPLHFVQIPNQSQSLNRNQSCGALATQSSQESSTELASNLDSIDHKE
jgi:hypothetical protein